MLWSDLHGHPRLGVELSKYDATLEDLVDDLEFAPGWSWEKVDRMSQEEQEYAALVYFGDEGNPQPAERTGRYLTEGATFSPTTDRETLRPLDDDTGTTSRRWGPSSKPGPDPDDVTAEGWRKALEMLGNRETKAEIERVTGLSTRAVNRAEEYWQDKGVGWVVKAGRKPGMVIPLRV